MLIKNNLQSVATVGLMLVILFSGVCHSEKYSDMQVTEEFVPEEFSIHLMNHTDTDEVIFEFYQERKFKPVWYGFEERLISLDKIIDLSENHGLPKTSYELTLDITFLDKYRFEILAMETFFEIASDMYSGVLEPNKIEQTITVFPDELSLDLLRERLTLSGDDWDPSEIILSFAPKSLEYKKLLDELVRLKEFLKHDGWGPSVPEGLFLGYKLIHPNVGKLRTRLFRMGYLTFDSKAELYDGELKSAVQLFQADHGLNADGVAGDYTIQAINVSPRTRLIQVLVNLERVRWKDYSKDTKYIVVNQPNFQAYLYENDSVIWQSRVVIGLPDHQTQEFSDVMTHLIINPVWHVPRSISVHEYLPIIQEDPNFLSDNDMILIVRGTNEEIDPKLIDMNKFEPDNFPFEIKQLPSNINALGIVKFMFPNEYNIYMHDTPMKELFFKDERTFSHGCVRVQDPFQFAYELLSPQLPNPEATFQRILLTEKESQINLTDTVPVNITYRTVFFGDYGQVQYRADIYGRDASLFMALQDKGLQLEI